MKKLDNLKDLPNTQEFIINIPKNINAMIVSYCYVDNKGELKITQENIDLKKLEDLENGKYQSKL